MRFLLLLVLTSLSFQSFATDLTTGWKKISSKDGIKVYTKSTKDSPIQYLRAKGIVSASVTNITAILRNVEHSKEWVPNLVERSYVQNISDTEAILYDVTDMPWPVSNREMILHHTLTVSEDKKWLMLNFKSVDHPNAKHNDDFVRAKVEFGLIKFRPIEDGERTELEMIILVDPMGAIPTWVVNLMQVSIPYDMIMALNEYAVETKFKPLPGVLSLINQVSGDEDKIANEN